MTTARWGAGFSAVGRFVAEVEAAAAGKGQLRPGYVLAGDELFLLDRCRDAVFKAFVPADLQGFLPLRSRSEPRRPIFEVLDRAQTPSLMSPFQVIFVRNVRQLYTRGAKKEEFAALERYFRSPNPQALLIFVADFLRIPTDTRRMEMDDKNRFERLTGDAGRALRHGRAGARKRRRRDALGRGDRAGSRYTLGARRGARAGGCARRGHDAGCFGAGKAAAVYASAVARITLGDVETMVLAAKQRSLYELTDAISSRNRARALALLQGC